MPFRKQVQEPSFSEKVAMAAEVIMNMDEWLSLSDAAKLLACHPSTVRLWSDKGVLPTHRTSGGHRRYRRNEVLFMG